MGQKKILAITGSGLRHRFFLQQVAPAVGVRTAFTEATNYPEPRAVSERSRMAWDWYFNRRRAYESRRFAKAMNFPSGAGPRLLPIPAGELNAQATLLRIQALSPDLILIFGTSLLKGKILSCYGGRIINLHLGLSQHYRGSSANFWPIHDRKPETLGATVHLVDPGIDTGSVLLRAPIALDPEDDEQTLAGKTLILGCRLMIQAVALWKEGRLRPRPQARPGRLLRVIDFTPESALRVRQIVESGELERLIARQKPRPRPIRPACRERGEC